MSGHSKWNNIKRKKEKTDSQKAKIFTKVAREIAVVVKAGGSDPSTNARLRDLISKAKGLNVPNDNIDRAVKKASEAKGDDYEAITYEGYGPGGVAVMVETLTDNRNRTAGNMRHFFDKFGGNMGTTGCVSFMFTKQGTIILSAENVDEEKLMEDVFEAGADDFDIGDEMVQITCTPEKVGEVREALEGMGYTVESAEAEYVPATTTVLTGEVELKKMGLLLDNLEEDDDVQEVWHSMENEEDLDR